MDDRDVDAIIRLGGLAAQFATIHRVTFLADGTTPESDTDHTVMLGVIACAVAAHHDTRLDVGLVAQFALVHDLVEAYAGDTNTFGGLSSEAHKEKEEKEAQALARIKSEFGATLPWIADTIEAYEGLESPEARFIKTMDKIMPKITRALNNHHQTSAADFDAHCAQQESVIRNSYGTDQEIALSLYSILTERVSRQLHQTEH